MVSAAGDLDLRGGHPVIDFVNTVAWRGDAARRLDYLVHYSDVLAWCRHSGVVPTTESPILMRAGDSEPAEARRAVARAKRLREALHAWFAGGSPAGLTTIHAEYVSAVRHRELRPDNDAVAWADREITLYSPIDRLSADAVGLITLVPRGRIKQCGDTSCGWLFLDTSHRQNRRWCSAADCGNRDRARRHYERSRGR
ncbi:MAG TPA: CGNR zinc finger domain-containing protein [Mycobacterium sp.]|jgi:predicted RNA-binding Zn ribbon-like protein|nr:CGNR zinc finger domain-containing protein [Mycobacterium sp.]